MTDPSLLKKVNIFQLFDGAFSALIHNALRVRSHSKSMGISQRTDAVGMRRTPSLPSHGAGTQITAMYKNLAHKEKNDIMRKSIVSMQMICSVNSK
jgi:hypothetical protein